MLSDGDGTMTVRFSTTYWACIYLSESLNTGQYRHDCYSSDEVCKCVNRAFGIYTGCLLLATGMDKMLRSTLYYDMLTCEYTSHKRCIPTFISISLIVPSPGIYQKASLVLRRSTQYPLIHTLVCPSARWSLRSTCCAVHPTESL